MATLYDPVKAHEYYLRTRELQGNKPNVAELKTEKKRQGFAYVKNRLDENKKAAELAAAKGREQEVAKLAAKAEKKREEISARIKFILALVSAKSDQSVEAISKQTQAKIDALPPIPKGLGREKTAELAAKRREDIAKIRGDARAETGKVRNESASSRAGVSNFGAKSRENVATELKASVDKARANYVALKTAIQAKYERDLGAEFKNIKTNV